MIKRIFSRINISDNKKAKALILCGFILSLVFIICSCNIFIKDNESWTPSVTIMLEGTNGIKIVSQNPIKVPLGSDAVFELEIEEGVVIDSIPKGAVLENGKLTLKSVFYPTTLKLDTHTRTLCEFSVLTEETDMGSVLASLENGKHWSETEIILTATPKEGFIFSGFSIGAPLSRGGTITSVDTSYSFVLSQNIQVYANFAKEWVDPATQIEVPQNKWALLYHSNGGVLSDTKKEGIKTAYFSNTYYLCPNTIPDRDFFERDGYILYGYNTKADGSGTYYGMGWNVVMPEIRAISLYCMWAKISDISDFEYTVGSNNTVTINKYKGHDEFVVIPETIEGKPVATVSAQAFINNTCMKKVLINKNIRTLQNKSFSNCSALKEMYFTDAVTSVGDGLLSDCPSFNKIYILAYVTPHYRKQMIGSYGIKYERLITADGPKLIMASGSNSSYGINSPLFEDLLKNGGHGYNVVNYGTYASTPVAFYVEVISAHVNTGDVVVLAPELSKTQYGFNEINATLWQIFEGAYNAFSDVDISGYSKFFSSFTTFNKARNQTSYDPLAYEYYNASMNSYGDDSRNRQGYTKNYANTVQELLNNGGTGTLDYNSCITFIKQYSHILNRSINMVKNNGGTVLISIGVTNKIALTATSQIAGGTVQCAYEAAIDQYLNGTRISDAATYTMDTEWFYDNNHHLGTAGAKKRTELLAADILNYFSKNK